MKKNLWLLGLLVFTFASCDTGTGGTKDVWSDITSLDQVNGTWVATRNESMPLIDAIEMLASLGLEMFDPNMMVVIQPLIKDIKIRITVKATMIIDANAETMSSVATTTLTFSGGNTVMLWEMMREMLPPEDISGVIISFDDKNHSLTMDMEEPATPITVEDFAEFQINQSGTKFKATTEYAGYEEIIFTKVQ